MIPVLLFTFFSCDENSSGDGAALSDGDLDAAEIADAPEENAKSDGEAEGPETDGDLDAAEIADAPEENEKSAGEAEGPETDTDGDADVETKGAAGLWDILDGAGPVLRDILGVSTHMKQDAGEDAWRDFEFEKYAELGGISIREDYHWHKIEPADDDWHMESVSTQVEMARKRGVSILAMLAYEVDWAVTGEATSSIDPAQYGEFAGRVAGEFCTDIKEYEIWNEPNWERFWPPEPDPDHYAKFLKAAYQEIKSACPDARVLSAGLSSWDLTRPLDRWWFLSAMHEKHPDICNYFDILAIHPYTFNQAPSPEQDYVLSPSFSYEGQSWMTQLARERLEEIGCGGKPIWITEMGWPSYELSEEDQGRFLARSILLAVRDDVEAYFWYTFWDGEPVTEGWRPQENYFGLFGWPGAEDPGREKPAWQALKGLADTAGDARFVRDLSFLLDLPNDVYALLFAGDDQALILALWDGRDNPDQTPEGEMEGGPDTTYDLELPLPSGINGVRHLDINGSELASHGGLDRLSLTLTPSVQYIVVRR